MADKVLLNKRRRVMKKVFISAVAFLLLAAYAAPALAAGPWNGKVIDVETKEPLEGAVVLAVWNRYYRTPTGGSTYFYEAKEVLTDKDGGFEIPSYTPINVLPIISYIERPEFIIFKPGYGSLQMALGNYLTGKMVATQEFTSLSGKPFRVSPGIVELPRLKTREERSMNIPSLPSWEHLEKEKLLIEKIHEEEENLGLEKSDPFKARDFILKGK